MKKIFLALSLALIGSLNLIGSPAQAEESKKKKKIKIELDDDAELHMLFQIGYGNLGLDALNTAMKAEEYDAFSPHVLSLGGSLQLVVNNVFTEIEGNGFLNQPVLNKEYLSWMSAGNFLVNLGYTLKPTPQFSIYPYVGIGAGFMDLKFNQRNVILTFQEFLKDPGRQAKLTNTMFLVNAGLGSQYTFAEKNEPGITIGLKGGYLWTPFASSWWQLEDTLSQNDDDNARLAQVSNGPAIAMNGPYIKAVMGF